jgi:hypothetical protein
MPFILTDEKIKEDCFNTRFPIYALPVLKVKTLVNKDNVVIQAPPVLPISYPASINSLSKGLANTLDMPQQKIKLFLENEVRAVENEVRAVQVEEEKVEELFDETPNELDEILENMKPIRFRKPRSDAGVKRGRNAAGRRKDESIERNSMDKEDFDVQDLEEVNREMEEVPIANLRGGEL